MIIDTHSHLQFKGLDQDREEIIKRIREKNTIVNLVGTQKNTSKLAVELAREHEDMYATIGTHPNHLFPTYIDEEESSFTSKEEDFDVDYYQELYNSAPDKIIGVGETGIDLFHIPDPNEIDTEIVLEKQKKVFLDHYKFAKNNNLALVIHTRDAKPDAKLSVNSSAHGHLIELLKSLNEEIRATVHCFSGNWQVAQEYLNLGCYLGFTGIITFPAKKTNPKQQEDLLEVVKNIPLDRILVETDSPYLAPQKYRGKRSEPWMCEEQIKFISNLRGVEEKELKEILVENSKRLFKKILN